jgi:hypothetical protein
MSHEETAVRTRDRMGNAMATKVERPEFWDDELEALSERATAILGDDVVSVAIERLFRQMRRAGTPVASFDEFKAKLKVELRRLVRPN